MLAVWAFVLSAVAAMAQGIATSNVAPGPKAQSSLPFHATFSDIARESGLTARYVLGEPGRKKYIIETNGSGAAFLDIDNDGNLDVFLVNGSRLRPFAKGEQPTNRLYKGNGKGQFVDVTRTSGVGRSGWGNGVCTGDVDNDGFEDMYVTYWGPNSLFRNKGDGSFEDVAVSAGVTGPPQEWSTGCTFIDYDRDGRLDLFVTSYLKFDPKTTPLPGQHPWCMFKDKPVYCGPRGLPHGTVSLYRNKGDGTFEDVSASSGVRKGPECYAFTATAADLNGDGWTDLYVACDSTPSLFLRNSRDGTFKEIGVEAGVAFNEHGAEQAGMGIAVADLNGDGWLDVTKTNFIGDYPNLYRNLGNGIFEDIVLAAGVGVNPQHVLWGTGLEDLDNDGQRDIFQVGGHVYSEIAEIDPSQSYGSPRIVYRNLGSNRFDDVSSLAGPAVATRHSSRGAAFGDFDNDGDMDVLIVNMDEPPSLLRNDLKCDRAWIKVRLEGRTSNRSAIGAIVTVHAGGRTQTAPVLSQSSFLSANDRRLHFGLGDATSVDRIVVRWPSGKTEEFKDSKIRTLVTLMEGTGT